jgi:hypothetical protein
MKRCVNPGPYMVSNYGGWMKSGDILLKCMAICKEIFGAVQIYGHLYGEIRRRQRQ